jgi:uncharacterized protein (TIGR00297 family)
MFKCIIGALALSAAFSALSYRLKLLTLSGAVAAGILGTVILGRVGWYWLVPMLAFFVSSSLLSRMRRHRLGEMEEERGSRRDAVQVLANGGIAGLIALLQDHHCGNLFPMYLGALAAVNADTWSTEIGLMLGRKPRSLINGLRVPAGTSGGVTLWGLLGALTGAALIAYMGYLVLPTLPPDFLWDGWEGYDVPLLSITLAGFAGSLFDSLLGATVQEKRRCPVCGKATEKLRHCGQPTERIGGMPGLNNDMVNLLCGVLGAILVSLI